jgi:5'-nucleotidase
MIIYIGMDDVLCDYTAAFNNAIEATPSIAFPQSQYGS